MDKERQSERIIAKRLRKIEKQLDRIAPHLLQSRIRTHEAPAESESGMDGLHSLLDQLSARIDKHLEACGQERDGVEARLRTMERAIAERTERASLRQAFEEAAFRPSVPKASAPRAAPADYTPVLTAAFQLIRDVGVTLIDRYWTPGQKPPPPSTGAETTKS
jgi:hypothetical protein